MTEQGSRALAAARSVDLSKAKSQAGQATRDAVCTDARANSETRYLEALVAEAEPGVEVAMQCHAQGTNAALGSPDFGFAKSTDPLTAQICAHRGSRPLELAVPKHLVALHVRNGGTCVSLQVAVERLSTGPVMRAVPAPSTDPRVHHREGLVTPSAAPSLLQHFH